MHMFRFQSLKLWQDAILMTEVLWKIADELENRKLFKFADQLRGAGLSISNNIAEGSGSAYKRDFSNFLNISRRSIFESANILILLSRRAIINDKTLHIYLDKLDHLSRKITNLQRIIKK